MKNNDEIDWKYKIVTCVLDFPNYAEITQACNFCLVKSKLFIRLNLIF